MCSVTVRRSVCILHPGCCGPAHQQTLAKALSAYFGTEVEVEITFGTADKETPRAANIRAKEERLAAAIDVLNRDPDLQEFKQRFDARLDEKTVRPID